MLSQFLFVSLVGGDCFNPMGHLSRWDLGPNRLTKVRRYIRSLISGHDFDLERFSFRSLQLYWGLSSLP